MDRLVNPLLGKTVIASVVVLGFIQEVDLNTDWVKRLPTLFQGLGSFGTRVKIALREGSSAFCQLAPRRVAAARRQPLQKDGEAWGNFSCRGPHRLVLTMCSRS